jgi:hypothetical protein
MLTIADLAKAGNDDRWLGFGYLGTRAIALSDSDPEVPAQPVLVEAADQRVIDLANERGWDYEDLFNWCNSKLGRWFGDAIFGARTSTRFDQRIDRAVRENLFVKVEAD